MCRLYTNLAAVEVLIRISVLFRSFLFLSFKPLRSIDAIRLKQIKRYSETCCSKAKSEKNNTNTKHRHRHRHSCSQFCTFESKRETCVQVGNKSHRGRQCLSPQAPLASSSQRGTSAALRLQPAAFKRTALK